MFHGITGSRLAGIAFGFIVLSNALVAAPISGACFNPAVAMLALLHGKYANMWVYTAGPLTGSFLAWAFFHVTSPEDAMGKTKSAESKPISIDALLTRMSVRMSLPPISDGNMTRMISMLAMEFVGTFMIAWVLALSINAAPSDQSIAIGTAVCSMVYIGGAVSGGHYNPCVTLGVSLLYIEFSYQHFRLLCGQIYLTGDAGFFVVVGLSAR